MKGYTEQNKKSLADLKRSTNTIDERLKKVNLLQFYYCNVLILAFPDSKSRPPINNDGLRSHENESVGL